MTPARMTGPPARPRATFKSFVWVNIGVFVSAFLQGAGLAAGVLIVWKVALG